MRKFNLFTKIITPLLFIGVIVSYIGYLYLNSLMQDSLNNEIEQKLENKVGYTYTKIESEFKLLFYLYGTVASKYEEQTELTKKDVLDQLKYLNQKSSDILYIIDPNEYVKLTNLYLTSSELARIVRTNQTDIEIDEKTYRIKQLYFKPWDWRIIYLLDTSNFQDIVAHNKLVLLGIVYVVLLLLILLIITIFKIYIKNPIDMLLNHFDSITKGEYHYIDKIYNTSEIDTLIDDVNNMTKSIQTREKESQTLLDLTQKNEAYMLDILSSQSSIIIINDAVKILDVNDSFKKFFHEYKSLDDFKMEHKCLSEFFVKEEGFIYAFEDKNWIDFVLEESSRIHKVKLFKDDKYYIFTIQAKKSDKFNRTIITMTDITKLEKANHLLEQYKKAVDAGTIVSKANPKGIITYVNDKFINISGYSREELINSNHNIVNHPNVDKSLFTDMWKTINSKQIWYGNIENRKKDGSSYMVAATIIPILDENNKIMEYIALRYDITEQMQAVERSQKAENTKSLFLANMSHEIRTPLNAIIGFTKILKNSKLNTKEANYINVIDQSAESLLGIVNDVLDMSKIENGSLFCESVEFNPFKEFNAIFDLFSAKASEKNINLISNIDSKILQTIIGDPLRIKQVLSNLISNAIKFSHENSNIELDIKLINQDNKTCKIGFSIKDYGIGISPDKQKTIFDDFTQADDSTSREYGGTGLGLSISSKIIQALGSHIEIESKKDEGSRFFFEIEYKINELNNKNLEELHKLKTGIILSDNIQEYDYENLKTYLDSITNLTIYENSDDYESIIEEDIIVLAENASFKNIGKVDKENSTKIIVLSHEKTQCNRFKNSLILNTPFNRSIIFDILVGFIQKEKNSIEKNNDEGYSQYTGKVLIAEDHEINQQLISMLLEFRGIEHLFASNGLEAIELFEKEKYDLILMDINMPVKNGKEATAEIITLEKEKLLAHTPIVALTANAIEADKKETMKIGFDDYLLKPIDEVKLDEVLTRYLKLNSSVCIDKSADILDTQNLYSLEDASEQTGLPIDIMHKIVENFISSVDEDLKNLKDAILSNHFAEIINFAHKIKGASLNLRMEKVSSITAKIESNAMNQNNTMFHEDFKNLETEIASVKKQILLYE